MREGSGTRESGADAAGKIERVLSVPDELERLCGREVSWQKIGL
jgi:hypothetical protein